MQRQSTIQEVAQSLGITEDAVSGSITSGLFLTIYDSHVRTHYLDIGECFWAWKEYVGKLAQSRNIDEKTKAIAIDHVRAKRVMIIESGEYFDHVPHIPLPVSSKDNFSLLGFVVGVLLFCVIVYTFISK